MYPSSNLASQRMPSTATVNQAGRDVGPAEIALSRAGEHVKAITDLVARLASLRSLVFGAIPAAVPGDQAEPSPSGFFPELERSSVALTVGLNEASNLVAEFEDRFGVRR